MNKTTKQFARAAAGLTVSVEITVCNSGVVNDAAALKEIYMEMLREVGRMRVTLKKISEFDADQREKREMFLKRIM